MMDRSIFAGKRLQAARNREIAIKDANDDYYKDLDRIDEEEEKAEQEELAEQVREAKKIFYGEKETKV
jgi:hypothetical protein